MVLNVTNELLGRFNFVDSVLKLWIGKLGLVSLAYTRYKFSVGWICYIGFGKLGSVAS